MGVNGVGPNCALGTWRGWGALKVGSTFHTLFCSLMFGWGKNLIAMIVYKARLYMALCQLWILKMAEVSAEGDS